MVNKGPGVNVEPVVSNHHKNVHRSLRSVAVTVTRGITRLCSSILHRDSNASMRYIVTSAAVNKITRTTVTTRGFHGDKINIMLSMAPY